MEDFVKSVVKNFSKEYRQQPLPTDLQAEVKARFHKEKKRSICFQVLVKQPATFLC